MCRPLRRVAWLALVVAAVVAALTLGAVPPAQAQVTDEHREACEEPLTGGALLDGAPRAVPEDDCDRLAEALLVAYDSDDVAEQIREGRRECVETVPSGFSQRLSDDEWGCLEEFAGTPMPSHQGFIESTVVGVGESMWEQLYDWVASGASWVLQNLMDLLHEGSGPQVTADWFTEHFGLMAGVAGLVMVPLLLVHTIVSVVRGDVGGLVRGYLVYVPVAALGTAVAIPLVDRGLAITDSLTEAFSTRVGADMETFVEGMLATLAPEGGNSDMALAFLTLLAGFILVGAIAVWLVLTLRELGILIALFLLPLAFAALVWTRTRPWFGRLVKLLAALMLSKFVIVAVVSLGAASLAATDVEGGGAGTLITGVGLLSVAALAPVLLLQIADVAGDQLAGQVEGVTQQRTSPVPMPRQTGARALNQTMDQTAARRANPGPSAGWTISPSSYLPADAATSAGAAGGAPSRPAGSAASPPGSNGSHPAGSPTPSSSSPASSRARGSGSEAAGESTPMPPPPDRPARPVRGGQRSPMPSTPMAQPPPTAPARSPQVAGERRRQGGE